MSDNTLKLSSGLVSLVLLVTLILKVQHVPGGMILSGLFLGGIVIVAILLVCIPFTALLKLLFKKSSYLTIYLHLTIIAFSYFHYTLYSPTLRIVVPHGYKGDVNLVLSNVKENILKLDSNGIGYVTQWTFDHTYTVPYVSDSKGLDINNLCVGFDRNAFWGKGTDCCSAGKQIRTMSFELVDKHTPKSYDHKSIPDLVNKELAIFVDPNYHQ